MPSAGKSPGEALHRRMLGAFIVAPASIGAIVTLRWAARRGVAAGTRRAATEGVGRGAARAKRRRSCAPGARGGAGPGTLPLEEPPP